MGGLGGGKGTVGRLWAWGSPGARCWEVLYVRGSWHVEPPVPLDGHGVELRAASMPSQPPALINEEYRVLGDILSPAVWVAWWPPLPGGGGEWAIGPEAQPWWGVGI